MTETQSKVIDILVAFPKTTDGFIEPIAAAARAMGWDSDETRAFVVKLVAQKMIVLKMDTVNRLETPDPSVRWVKPTTEPDGYMGQFV